MKNILVCVTGLTPQIITESIYCLSVQQNIEINELYLLTTQRGKTVLEGNDKDPKTPDSNIKTEINSLCRIHNIKPPIFEINDKHVIVAKEESLELSDIRTDNDNILFPNKTAEFIRGITAKTDNVLYCSISGGRKTMSVHLANALSLFGREHDKLLHVITNPENEFKGYYPQTLAEDKALEIAEIPFIRLRSLIPSTLKTNDYFNKSYSYLVELTQKRLKELTNDKKIILNTISREVNYDNNLIRLEPLEFAIYYKFVERKIEDGKNYSIHELITPEYGIEIKDFLDQYLPNYHLVDSMIKPWWKKGFDDRDIRSKRSKINSKLKRIFPDSDIYNKFKINSEKIYGNTNYFISANKNSFSIITKN